MQHLKKVFPFLLLFMMGLGNGLVFSAPLHDHPQPIIGTWLYLWWHGSASIGKDDGTASSRFMFIPESYRETEEEKSESFFRFRADGTGCFFRRYIKLTYENRKSSIIVVAKKSNGEWAEVDQLDVKAGFRWQINGSRLILKTVPDGPRFHQPGRYEFVINAIPTRPASRELKSRMKLQDELIIYKLGQFLRLGNTPEQDLLRQYQIP